MKEITEKGTAYVVSDNYPELPYTKQIKNKGGPPVPEAKAIDLTTLTDKDFQKIVLEGLGFKVK